MSDISLSFHAILVGVSYDAFLSSCWSARKRSSLASGVYVDVLLVYAHTTACVLSQKLPMSVNVK